MWNSLIIVFSTFTRIPMPRAKWDDKNISGSVLWLPVVGMVIGALEAVMLFIADRLNIPSVAISFFYVIIPIAITGGIHLDGLIDTADARHSYQDADKKHEILKDAHVGAFGVIRLALYLMCVLAFLIIIFSHKIKMKAHLALIAFALPFIVSRALTAFCVFWFEAYENEEKSGMLISLKKGMNRAMKYTVLLEAVAALAAVFFVFPVIKASAIVLLQLIFLCLYKHFSKKEFQGTSGDLCGWYLCISELLFAIGAVV